MRRDERAVKTLNAHFSQFSLNRSVVLWSQGREEE